MQVESDNATLDAYGDAIPGMNDIGAMQPDDQAIYEGITLAINFVIPIDSLFIMNDLNQWSWQDKKVL